jgi:uncharacterized protein YwqG
MSREDGELDGLIAQLIAKTKVMAATEHIGRLNRLFSQREQIYAEIEAKPGGPAALIGLFDDPDPHVQLAVARHCRYRKINVEAALNALQRLAMRPDEIGNEAKFSLEYSPIADGDAPTPPAPRALPFLPAPRGCDRREAERMINAALAPQRAKQIVDLLRPSIRIWPKKSSGSPTCSRFGGRAAVPRRWKWPVAEEEPFVFLAQINCAELGPLAASFNLPSQGILSFFGDHDDINGVPANGGAVFYFADPSKLVLRASPMPEDEPLISCDVGFYETYEIPHPSSAAVEALGIGVEHSREEWEAYYDLYGAIVAFGLDREQPPDGSDISKLFGWPDLVQREIYEGKSRLLLQLGGYHDGNEQLAWGPGGALYFMIMAGDLATGKFERAELDVQVT